MQTHTDGKSTSFAGQLVRDVMLVAMLAVVVTLIGIRTIARGLRTLGLLPHKEASEPC